MTAAVRRPIVIWGAGAIGGVIGAYLARSGEEILYVDIDADHVGAVNAGGMRIEGPIETFAAPGRAFTPDAFTQAAATLAPPDGRFGAIFLCAKAPATLQACRQIAPLLAEDGFVLSLQNGLNEIAIAEAVGAPRTVGAFINFGADYYGPGEIFFGGRGAVVLGEIDGAETPRLAELRALLSRFDPDAVTTREIWGYLWGKLGYGALLFATALTNDSIAGVLAMDRFRPMLAALAQEMTATADAAGVAPRGFNGYDPAAFRAGAPWEASVASFDAMVAHNAKSAKTHSGIWRDLAVRKRKTEVDPQLTMAVAEAARLGVPVPLTRRLIALIQDIEAGRRPLAIETLEALDATWRESAGRESPGREETT